MILFQNNNITYTWRLGNRKLCLNGLIHLSIRLHYNLNLMEADKFKETNNLRAHHQPWRRSVRSLVSCRNLERLAAAVHNYMNPTVSL